MLLAVIHSQADHFGHVIIFFIQKCRLLVASAPTVPRVCRGFSQVGYNLLSAFHLEACFTKFDDRVDLHGQSQLAGKAMMTEGGSFVVGSHVTYGVLIAACHAYILILSLVLFLASALGRAKKEQNHSTLGRAWGLRLETFGIPQLRRFTL